MLMVFSLFAAVFLFSCANRGTLEGGPKDSDPPKLDSLNSASNYQVRFQKQDITLAFDEWVELRDVVTQVVISPPLEFRPKIERRKRAIVVEFDEKEVLRDSATYVFNFGQAIRDLTEGNPASIVFVFSTGDYIDSLSLDGRVIDASSGLPVDGAVFLLYENLADTVVYKERPFYFARTNKDGLFKVNNVKAGTFKAVALLDANQNYKYEPESEKIGFLDSVIVVAPPPVIEPDTTVVDSISIEEAIIDTSLIKTDSLKAITSAKYKLKLFEKEKSLFLRQRETGTYGIVKLGFNRPPHDADLQFDFLAKIVFRETDKDTLKIWYTLEADTAWQIYFKRDTIIDTIDVAAGLKGAFGERARLSNVLPLGESSPTKIAPGSSYIHQFNHPVASVNLQRVELFQDTLKLPPGIQAQPDSLNPRFLNVNYPWKEGGVYRLRLLPGSVTDIYGLVNEDTIQNNFAVGLTKEYGILRVSLKGLENENPYHIRLLAANQSVIKSWQVSQLEQFDFTIAMLNPGLYKVEVTEDLDGNGRWTSGDYDLKRQPERVFKKTLEQLRANWELVSDVLVSFE